MIRGPEQVIRIGAILALFLMVAEAARAAPLVADLSKGLVAITAGFAGADVLLFGAIDEPGDVVVVVQGPSERVAMHRKSRVAGVWINTATMTFDDVPSFYAIASTRPLDEIAGESVLTRLQMGVERLRLPLPSAKASPNVAQVWRQALIRNKQQLGLYPTEVSSVEFRGERLFRTLVKFPANVPTGTYQVVVYLLRENDVVKAQTIPLSVSKIGMEAFVFDFAHERRATYGVVAILVALMAGWLAHAAFRKD